MNGTRQGQGYGEVTFQELSGASFGQALRGEGIAVVDFWAPWCAPCRAMGTILDRVAPRFAGRISFFKVNVDTEPSLASRFGIVSIPTLMAFKGTQVLSRFEGKVAERDVEHWLESLLA